MAAAITRPNALAHVESESSPGKACDCWQLQAVVGKPYEIGRVTVVHSRRETPEPERAVSSRLEALSAQDLSRHACAHQEAWRRRWHLADVVVDGDVALQTALRFALFHLIGTGHPEDPGVSIGARGLSGNGYMGHVFWDAEMFMLPFFTVTHPPTARAMLCYRFNTLPAARERASDFGFAGALYAWESADTGHDVTPTQAIGLTGETITVCTGKLSHHISADVAHGVWRYWVATGDEPFMLEAGAEILLEVARFWHSRSVLEADGYCHIRHVIGPDEYHVDVDDNAYTNVMAQWSLERAVEVAGWLQTHHPERWTDLSNRLGLQATDISGWTDTACRLVTGLDPATGVIEQFAGFSRLMDVPLPPSQQREVVLEAITPVAAIARTRTIKQADAIMLLQALPDRFPEAVQRATFTCYEPRTIHGSSLSPGTHALVAARLGDLANAERYLRMAAQIDLDNTMGNAAFGVHMAALGNLWQAVTQGFAGLRVDADGIRLDPRLLPGWRSLAFPIQYHGLRLHLRMTPDRVVITAEGPGNVAIALGSAAPLLLSSGCHLAQREGEGWRWRTTT
jgi:kojibiose phosphorylase